MKLLNLNEEAQETLKTRFQFPKKTFQVDQKLQTIFNSTNKASNKSKYLTQYFYILTLELYFR